MLFFDTTARTKCRFELGQNTDSNVCYNLKKHKISTKKEFEDCDKAEKARELTVPEQEERAMYLHHNYKKQ